MSEQKIKRKVIRISMLGDSTVGKTSIINAFLNVEFNNTLLSNIGIEKTETKMKMKDGNEMKLIIWDTAGQERFHSISTGTIKNAQGIVVSFDVTNKKTFLNVKNWLEDIRETNDKIPIVLFGNKCDLIERRQVEEEEAQEFAKSNNLTYFETSAKENINIKDGFKKIAQEAYEKSGGSLGMQLNNNKNKKKKDKSEGRFC